LNNINWQNEYHGNPFYTFFNSGYSDADKKGPADYTARALLRGIDNQRQEYMHECEKVYPSSVSNREAEQQTISNNLKSNDGVISINPNPAKNNFTLNYNGVYSSLNIEEISGKVVFSQALNLAVNSQLIDVSTLNNGLYLVKLKNENSIVILKLIVNK
jgi:hypothetical protein